MDFLFELALPFESFEVIFDLNFPLEVILKNHSENILQNKLKMAMFKVNSFYLRLVLNLKNVIFAIVATSYRESQALLAQNATKVSKRASRACRPGVSKKCVKESLFWAAANGGVTNGGLRGVWPPFLEIGRNRPKSGGCEERLGNPENGGKRPFSSDILGFP